MINYLKNNEIFIIHTHGSQTSFKIAPDNNLSLGDIENQNLSNLNFALLMTCNTGVDYDPDHITSNSPENIVEQMVICGAETVVGFSDLTFVADCNRFAPDITEKLIKSGFSVEDAIDNISYTFYKKNMANIAVIAGNGNNTLR